MKKTANPKNMIAVRYPELCKEWNYRKNGNLTPETTSSGSGLSYWWICEKGHEWKTSVRHRIEGSSCPFCSGHRLCLENCLATKYPKIAKEWHPTKNGKLTPFDVLLGSNIDVWWICLICNNVWEARIDSRKISGCPKCTKMAQSNLRYPKSFADENPDLIKEWHPTKNGRFTPYMFTPNSERKFNWICKNNHEWKASLAKRNRSNMCPVCKIDSNCLAAKSPELISEWHPTKNGKLTPWNISNRSGKKVWWICPRCNREWQAFIANRSKGHGCECYRNVVLKDGEHCDSMLEALFYLKYKKEKNEFIHHGLYGEKMGKHAYDFYFPQLNTYIEVTSFHGSSYKYKIYLRTINKKKRYVEDVLGANFKFIEYQPTKKEYRLVKNNMRQLS